MSKSGASPLVVNTTGATRNGAGISAVTWVSPAPATQLPTVATPSGPVVAAAPVRDPAPVVIRNVTFAPAMGCPSASSS